MLWFLLLQALRSFPVRPVSHNAVPALHPALLFLHSALCSPVRHPPPAVLPQSLRVLPSRFLWTDRQAVLLLQSSLQQLCLLQALPDFQHLQELSRLLPAGILLSAAVPARRFWSFHQNHQTGNLSAGASTVWFPVFSFLHFPFSAVPIP